MWAAYHASNYQEYSGQIIIKLWYYQTKNLGAPCGRHVMTEARVHGGVGWRSTGQPPHPWAWQKRMTEKPWKLLRRILKKCIKMSFRPLRVFFCGWLAKCHPTVAPDPYVHQRFTNLLVLLADHELVSLWGRKIPSALVPEQRTHRAPRGYVHISPGT